MPSSSHHDTDAAAAPPSIVPPVTVNVPASAVVAQKKAATAPLTWTVADASGIWYIYAPHWATRATGVLVCVHDTFVKRTTAMSWLTPEWAKRQVLKGQELRIAEEPMAVSDENEKKRHKWTHLHRVVKLGEMERCKAELIEARKRLGSATAELSRSKKVDTNLEKAKRALMTARMNLRDELAQNKAAGLPVDVDPFSEEFTQWTEKQLDTDFSIEGVGKRPVQITPFSYSVESGLTGGDVVE